MTKCIAIECDQPSEVGQALCPNHLRKMQIAESETLRAASKRIAREMRQFERLMYLEPPIPAAEMAHRLVWPLKDVQKMLRKFKDDRQ